MQLYFRPFACSLASRIAIIESGQEAAYRHVNGDVLDDGVHFHAVNSLGYVPALDIGEDEVLTENTAILQYIADRAPASGLLPPVGAAERYRVLQWLGYVSTELHNKIFAYLFNSAISDDTKAIVRERAQSRFARLSEQVAKHDFLVGDQFTIADAYLVSVLNWFEYAGLDIKAWPVLADYRERLRRRPSVAQATAEERPLLKAA